MGLKKKMMMQAAAAAAAAEAEDAAGSGVTQQTFTIGEEDPLWPLQASVKPTAVQFRGGAGDSGADAEASGAPTSGSKAPSKFKWQTSLDEQFKFDFATAVPKHDIGSMNYGDEVKGVMRSDAGAEGVFFVQTAGGAVVVKGSKSIAAEAFSGLLGNELGVYSPRWRIISIGSAEGKAMIAGLSAKDSSGRVKLNLGSLTHVLLKEYLPGTNLDSLGATRAAEVFSNATRLREVGRILALDVLCNNGDRFPLIWDNRGNPGNVMISKDGEVAASIDSQIQPISAANHRVQYDIYLTRVTELSRSLQVSGESRELPDFKRVRDKLLEFTGYDVGETGSIEMQKGFLEISNHKDDFGISHDKLTEWQKAITSYKPELVGTSSADPDFVMAVWNLL